MKRTAGAQEVRNGKSDVGKGERRLRMGADVLCMVCGLVFLKRTQPGYLVAISGCIPFLTGLVRWSPLWP